MDSKNDLQKKGILVSEIKKYGKDVFKIICKLKTPFKKQRVKDKFIMISQPTLEEFKQFKEKVDNFCRRTFSAWDSRLLFEAAEDREFMNFIATFIDKAKTKLSYTELDALFSTLKNAADEALHRTQQENNLDKKFDFVNRTMALMGFIECMNEDSTLPEQILSDIKEKKREWLFIILARTRQEIFFR